MRTASKVSALGAPSSTSIGNSIGLGPRLRFQLFKRLGLEGEIGLFPSSTRANDVSVVVLAPRGHVVFDFPRLGDFRPMMVLGVGGPTGLSANSDVLHTGIQVEGYGGGGVAYSRGGGLSFRLDIRGHAGPGRDDSKIAAGFEVLIGISYQRKSRGELGLPPSPRDLDRDGDGISDADDKCPNRAEDKDGFKDDDGCPDIDDDMDEVLDVADRCKREPETYNGFKDNDGCPDSLPADLAKIVGVVKNLIFYPRTTRFHRRAKKPLRQLAAVLTKYEAVRIELIAHTDNSGDADANLILSKYRVEAVRDKLVEAGIADGRMKSVGRGGEQPLVGNDTAKERFQNNRIELKIHVRKR